MRVVDYHVKKIFQALYKTTTKYEMALLYHQLMEAAKPDMLHLVDWERIAVALIARYDIEGFERIYYLACNVILSVHN